MSKITKVIAREIGERFVMLDLDIPGFGACLREGCAVDAITQADILVASAADALDLLLKRKRMKPTLRY